MWVKQKKQQHATKHGENIVRTSMPRISSSYSCAMNIWKISMLQNTKWLANSCIDDVSIETLSLFCYTYINVKYKNNRST